MTGSPRSSSSPSPSPSPSPEPDSAAPSVRVLPQSPSHLIGDGAPQRSPSIVGTPVYMAPEQAVQADVGAAADWYSFGVILFEALTKQLPHDSDTALAVMLDEQRIDAPRASSI